MLRHFSWVLSTCLNFLGFSISNYTGPLNVNVKIMVARWSRGVKKPCCETQQWFGDELKHFRMTQSFFPLFGQVCCALFWFPFTHTHCFPPFSQPFFLLLGSFCCENPFCLSSFFHSYFLILFYSLISHWGFPSSSSLQIPPTSLSLQLFPSQYDLSFTNFS